VQYLWLSFKKEKNNKEEDNKEEESQEKEITIFNQLSLILTFPHKR